MPRRLRASAAGPGELPQLREDVEGATARAHREPARRRAARVDAGTDAGRPEADLARAGRGGGILRVSAERIITARWDDSSAASIEGYVATGGYRAIDKALSLTPAEVIAEVKASGLRGRGGAGFPTASKWSFVPQDTGKPTYLVVNFDESEPGTFNNREPIERDPHQLIEGALIAAYAIGSHAVFIYSRGEFLHPVTVLERAVAEARERGNGGKGIAGSDYDIEVVVHRGAGAYICGEGNALLSSLEGQRGQPRLRPPFPVVEGLYAAPTAINN